MFVHENSDLKILDKISGPLLYDHQKCLYTLVGSCHVATPWILKT